MFGARWQIRGAGMRAVVYPGRPIVKGAASTRYLQGGCMEVHRARANIRIPRASRLQVSVERNSKCGWSSSTASDAHRSCVQTQRPEDEVERWKPELVRLF